MDPSDEFAAKEIVRAARFLAGRGWAPAGSGNYSHRCPDGAFAITVSGADKRELRAADVMRLDPAGAPLDGRSPSAETALHLAIYRLYPEAQAVVHSHSIAVVVLSHLSEGVIRLEGYELLKAFPGVATHACALELPVFDNSQDMAALAQTVDARLQASPAPAFVIRDHGLYGWGRTMDEALNAVEAAETLIACELELMRFGRRSSR
ncbi:MAG TPA: methylthioribulose 1-phosphate dehydratase [Caulobacteraceae bacterium]|jgi:methylthioribulose-1-phosphate dehydratase|nr:methylthioribulose 1-phosphate dehydratase [Caulobacteraceae bacterium]